MTCPLCQPEPENVVWRDDECRVILVDEPDFPGFCRVIWQEHVAEMSDLPAYAQRHLLHVVLAVEEALREVMRPDKINLASLGNVVPHLHWHVIPRFAADSHFPNPIWGTALRAGAPAPAPDPAALNRAIVQALAAMPGN